MKQYSISYSETIRFLFGYVPDQNRGSYLSGTDCNVNQALQLSNRIVKEGAAV
jgi:hypothetical protein